TPYPYDSEGRPIIGAGLPDGLLDSLEHHRQRFAGLVDRVVPIDLTPPEDWDNEPEYGGSRLREGLLDLLASAPGQPLRSLELARAGLYDLYERQAMPTIMAYSSMAATAGAVPLPVLDLVLIAGVQTAMLNQLSKLYGKPISTAEMRELGAAL